MKQMKQIKQTKPKNETKTKKGKKQTMKNGEGLAKVKALSHEVNKIGKPEPLKISPFSLLSAIIKK